MKKVILVLFFVLFSAFLFNVNDRLVFAQSEPASIVQEQIKSFLQQIIVLLQKIIEIKKAELAAQQVKNQAAVLPPPVNSPSGRQATLIVRSSGVRPFVSINGQTAFEYTNPITLNDGDFYAVTASVIDASGSSISKCSGRASPGGFYTCNININR
jgi:hypothetical protein